MQFAIFSLLSPVSSPDSCLSLLLHRQVFLDSQFGKLSPIQLTIAQTYLALTPRPRKWPGSGDILGNPAVLSLFQSAESGAQSWGLTIAALHDKKLPFTCHCRLTQSSSSSHWSCPLTKASNWLQLPLTFFGGKAVRRGIFSLRKEIFLILVNHLSVLEEFSGLLLRLNSSKDDQNVP